MYLVTGGAGFIGSNIVRRLRALNLPVRIIDDFSTGKRENLQGLADVELIGAERLSTPLTGERVSDRWNHNFQWAG